MKASCDFNWNTPIHLSPTRQGTSSISARSSCFGRRDHGQTWDRISPDLTTNDPEKQKQEESGGVTVDNSVAEMHTTIYSISESPKNAQVIWAGTDDGNLQLTRDGGKTWTNVVGNVPDLPKSSWVSWVEASRFEEGTAHCVTSTGTCLAIWRPYAYQNKRFRQDLDSRVAQGQRRTRLCARHQGRHGFVKLLFLRYGVRALDLAGWRSTVGAVQGPRISECGRTGHRDSTARIRSGAGDAWTRHLDYRRHLAAAPINARGAVQGSRFLESKPAQQRIPAQGGWAEGDAHFLGDNPPDAALITYYQKKRHIFGRMKLEVLDDKGKLVDTLARRTAGAASAAWNGPCV